MRIPIVDENDEIIKVIDIDEREQGDICRVTGLWVTNKKDEILLAKRALTKRRDPGCWGPAVSGTVEEGETYEQNIIKEAREEIGLENIQPRQEEKRRISISHEYFSQWFSVAVDSNYPFVKNDSEVEEIRWFSKNDIIKSSKENPDFFVPSFYRNVDYFLQNAS